MFNTKTSNYDPKLLKFFGLRQSIVGEVVSSSQIYGHIASGSLAGVPIGGLIGDQQAALIGNKCLLKGEAKCTYGTGAFLLFCTGNEVVKSGHGLLSTVAFQPGHNAKPVFALEGSSTYLHSTLLKL